MSGPYLKALIYGDSGSGKTWWVGTFTQCEDTSPVLVLNSRGQPITFQLFDNPPFVFNIGRMEDYNLPYKWLLNGQPWSVIQRLVQDDAPNRFAFELWRWAAERYDLSDEVMADPDGVEDMIPKFKTLAIDSLTQTQRISLRQIAGDLDKLPGDIPSQTTYGTWGKTLGQLTLLADLYFKLDMHVVITALRRHQFLENQGRNMYYPFFWGQSANELPSYAEMLGMLVPVSSLPVHQDRVVDELAKQSGEIPFNVLLLRGSRTHNAKWQGVRNPPEMLVNPTASKVIRILNSA